MSCDDARRLIQSDLDGDMSDAEADALKAHLGGCTRCAQESAALRQAVAAMDALPALPAPPELMARLGPQLDRLSRQKRTWHWAPAGTIAAGLLLALSLGYFQAGSDPTTPGTGRDQLAMEPPSAQEILEWVDASADPTDLFTYQY
jgi:anti-sigma factor RsiW